MAFKEDFIDVHGARIQLLSGGSGEPLIYLHSAGGEMAWLPFFDQLSRDFKLYVPAHPGFAGSEGLDRIDTIADLVFHYVDVMDVLGLEAAYFAGLSLGGWIAAEFAVHQTHRVRKLVLIDAVGLRVEDAPPMAEIFAISPRQTRELVFLDPEADTAQAMIPDVPPPDRLEPGLKAREATARVGWNPYLYDPRLRERLYRITMPALIVWGAADRLAPIEYGKAYRDGIKGARLVTVEKSGHAPPFEQPEQTARVITDFFKK
ncbi:MAG: alpha/beta fold hydrolase [Candidatus Binataceae bacterium]